MVPGHLNTPAGLSKNARLLQKWQTMIMKKNQVILNSELAVAVVMLVLVSNIAVSGDYICVDCGTLRLVCI